MRFTTVLLILLLAGSARAEDPDIVAIQANVLQQMEELGLAPERVPLPHLVSQAEMESIVEQVDRGGQIAPRGYLAITLCHIDDPQAVFYLRELNGRRVPWDRMGAIVAYEIHRSAQCLDGRIGREDWRSLVLEAYDVARLWAERFAPQSLEELELTIEATKREM